MVAESGHFDSVPVEKVNDARTALLTALWADHKDAMRTLNKGDKPSDETKKLIDATAQKTMKGFEK